MRNINNKPEYANEYKYIVARADEDNEFWFWGAYNDWNVAAKAATEISGMIFNNKKIGVDK